MFKPLSEVLFQNHQTADAVVDEVRTWWSFLAKFDEGELTFDWETMTVAVAAVVAAVWLLRFLFGGTGKEKSLEIPEEPVVADAIETVDQKETHKTADDDDEGTSLTEESESSESSDVLSTIVRKEVRKETVVQRSDGKMGKVVFEEVVA